MMLQYIRGSQSLAGSSDNTKVDCVRLAACLELTIPSISPQYLYTQSTYRLWCKALEVISVSALAAIIKIIFSKTALALAVQEIRVEVNSIWEELI